AVLLLEFFDADGKREYSIPDMGIPTVFGQHFRYLNENANDLDGAPRDVLSLRLPLHIERVRLSIAAFGIEVDEQVDIRIGGRCYVKVATQNRGGLLQKSGVSTKRNVRPRPMLQI